MPTECNAQRVRFQALGRREVTARFDGGAITSDAGGLLLREVESRPAFSGGSPPVSSTTAIRNWSNTRSRNWSPNDLCPGPGLRRPQRPRRPAARSALGRPGGQDRSDRPGSPPTAGPRQAAGGQEHAEPLGTDARAGRCQEPLQKDRGRHARHRGVVRGTFLALHPQPPKEIVLDFDATDDPIHGDQAGPVLSRLLQRVLLLAAVYFLRRGSAVRQVAAGGHRWRGGLGETVGADRGADSPAVARTCGSSCAATAVFAART